ncbi:MAG: hypothetical protein ACPLZF_00075 [Nitrososphaeria archaeon]
MGKRFEYEAFKEGSALNRMFRARKRWHSKIPYTVYALTGCMGWGL